MLTLGQLDEGYSRELPVLFLQLPVNLQSFQINNFLKSSWSLCGKEEWVEVVQLSLKT